MLLHSNDNRPVEAKSRRCLLNPVARNTDTNSLSTNRRTSGTEGNNVPQESSTRVAYLPAQKCHTADSIVRPTISELLTQKDNRRKEDNKQQ